MIDKLEAKKFKGTKLGNLTATKYLFSTPKDQIW